jgi:type IV pilus assembly protein PilF
MMYQSNLSPRGWLSWLVMSLIALGTLVGLAGCAGGAPSGAMRNDIVTDSDEPEARRRARIRLELAVGYFEQGQTTVALDELKQALVTDPGYADAYNMRGLIYMRLNVMSLAEESFKRALSLKPGDSDTQHNLGWLQCQRGRHAEAVQQFSQALANPTYGGRAKTWMAQGLCQLRDGKRAAAEQSLLRSYELDAANPITGYNLAQLMMERGELVRAQFYVRRINNSELANAESLWLGMKIERRMQNADAVAQLGSQLKKRFASSKEFSAYERGAFDE